MKNTNYLIDGLKEWNIQLEEYKLILFSRFYKMIMEVNKNINVTSIINEKDFIIKHILDSISSSLLIDFNGKKAVDIGSGAGFPGIPLKILFPTLNITFIESSGKKSHIIESICNELNITGFSIINKNVEEVGSDVNYRDKFDIALTRALAQFNVILEYAIPLIKEKGVFIAYKGPNVLKEVENSYNALNILNSIIKKNVEIKLPLSDYRRTIIVVEKLWKTDSKYPRKTGIPRKRHL